MDQAGWVCESCGDGREELNVHHTEYRPDYEPWELPANSLRCLCRTCHTLQHLPREKVLGFADKIFRMDAQNAAYEKDYALQEQEKMWAKNPESKVRWDRHVAQFRELRAAEEKPSVEI